MTGCPNCCRLETLPAELKGREGRTGGLDVVADQVFLELLACVAYWPWRLLKFPGAHWLDGRLRAFFAA